MPGLLGGLAFLCLAYWAFIFLFMGFGTWFFMIWAVIGIGFALAAWLVRKQILKRFLPRWLRNALKILLVCVLGLFIVVEGLIIGAGGAQASPGADYCIVLGAQWKQNGPSTVLRYRLDAAVQYLAQNPQTLVIVSGGQGPNEPIAEARGMQEYLIGAGVDPERIITEDQAVNTLQNLVFSAQYLKQDTDRVVIVTNDFHVFRALGIARKQGYRYVEGLAADSYPWMLPNNLLREFLGVLKDFARGNL